MIEERPLAAEVAAACRDTGLLEPGDRVLVAASAGADSTALALLLDEARAHGLPLALALAHVDHGWRPEDAHADREAVAALADRISAPFTSFPPPSAPLRTEADARRHRYRCLDQGAGAHACAKVATGHHLRDQAETVLMRLLRGSGPAGLRGIPDRRPLGEAGLEVVRPLLTVDPRRLRAWLEARCVPWLEDRTNADVTRDRARARSRILELEARGGTASRDLAAVAARLERRLAAQESALGSLLDKALVAYPEAHAIEIERAVLADLAPGPLDTAFRLLGRRIRAEREGPWFTRRHLMRVREMLDRGGALDLPRGLCFEVSGRRAWLRRRSPAPAPLPRIVLRRIQASSFDLDGFLAERSREEAALDADRLGGSPEVRVVRPSDRFTPWSRSPDHHHEVGVLDWLARRQVPTWLRRRQIVVEGVAGVAWLPGYRVDLGAAVTERTAEIAHLCLEREG